MLTLTVPKAGRRSRTGRRRSLAPKSARSATSDDASLVNAIGAAASRDLAVRMARVEADEAALVNAVARAAARSLAS
ncbi:MAG: hypothetical protein HZA93_24820 [Verrucomicrobia bacterium]|nr:hypothetical protein [Verrucomicrobiota bacterium]